MLRRPAARPRRSKIERLVGILESVAANGPIRRTRIMYSANLTWAELKEDLAALRAQGALRELVDGNSFFYVITPLGLESLRHFSRVKELLEVDRPAHGA